jgi:subtilase family serine protease
VSTKEASYTLHAVVVGEHNVSAVATNENGTDMQTWVWNILQPTDLPDLVIADKWEKGKTDRYKVFFVVENIGTATAPRGHYATLYVDGEEMEHKLVPKDLKPGASYKGIFRTRVELTGDSDTIKVCADNDNDVEESDEDNNCLENEWPCEVGKPDLEIEDKWEEWVGENRYIVHYVIHNKGTGIAPAGHHTTLIVDGEEVEHKPVPEELAHCETYTDTFDTEITCTDGSDTIMVCADNDNEVEESDEDNNCLENEWPCEVGQPDLVIADKYERGMPDRYNVFFVVENVGTATAPRGHYATLYVDGEEMEHKLVPRDLEPGESYKGRFRAKVKLTGDSDTIKVCADNDNDVDEADETNNCLENVWP